MEAVLCAFIHANKSGDLHILRRTQDCAGFNA
jgi:hypothetical protein